MIPDDKKKRIESLSTDEMLFEINLGRKSRFQKEKFAHLKTCYELRLSEENKKFPGEQSMATKKTSESPKEKHNPMLVFSKKDQKGINLLRIAEGVIVFILGVFAIYILGKYFGIDF